MALEKVQGTQVVSWHPPLPQRLFQIRTAGVTSDNTNIGGLGTDGARYGYFTLYTNQWELNEGLHVPPVQPGEQFFIYQLNSPTWTVWINPPVFGGGGSIVPSQIGAIPGTSVNVNGPDLYNVYGMQQGREMGGAKVPIVLADPVMKTVIAVQQVAGTLWNVYYSPNTSVSISPSTMGIATVPRPFSPKYLGQLGHVSGLNYTYSLPGGPNQLTCMLQVEPTFRTDALNPGRIITAHRGCSCIWEGQLTEPVPSANGWELTANGVGSYGTNFAAWYQKGAGPTTKSNGWFPDGPVDLAISRGLRWNNDGIGHPAGIYTGPIQNPGSLTVTDFMNLLCTGGSLTWELQQPASCSSWPPGPWTLKVFPLPSDQYGNVLQSGPPAKVQTKQLIGGKWKRVELLTARPRQPPDLFLINTAPVARTVANDYNTIILYYQVTGDTTATSTTKAQAATFATTFVDHPGSVALHGRMEYFIDISNGGNMTAAQAQKIGLNILSRYIRANFSGSFTVQPGQLVNSGGVPVDLGCNWNGSVVTVQGVNAAQGGEVSMAPLTFTIGQYAFDDTTQTATVTPFQSALTDMGSVISALYPGKFA